MAIALTTPGGVVVVVVTLRQKLILNRVLRTPLVIVWHAGAAARVAEYDDRFTKQRLDAYKPVPGVAKPQLVGGVENVEVALLDALAPGRPTRVYA
jgi:hypothetical protein